MKPKFSLRTLLLGVIAFAVVAAVQAKLAVNVSEIESQVQANVQGFSAILMHDAELEHPRHFAGMGGGIGGTTPAVANLEAGLTDIILFRRQVVVAFRSSESKGRVSRTFNHTNTYLITPFGVSLIDSEEEWLISFHL